MQNRNNPLPLPRSDEPLYEWARRLTRWSRLLYARYRRRRRYACIRCGNAARMSCRACGARVCNRCWVLSIETGAPAALCLDCVSSTVAARSPSRGRPHPSELLRAGARTLAWLLGAVAAVGFWQHGTAGIWRVLAFLLQPAALLGAVPLALVLGAIRIALGKSLTAILASRKTFPSA
ncbi:MAG: hypothetical protein ACREQQ_07430 [Candidatus Binatia bacterium]